MDCGPLIGLRELCEASGARPDQIELWCKRGILVAAQDSTGAGVPRGFDHANILQATQFVELAKAGLTGRQLHRIASMQRARLAHLSPAARIVGYYRLYISTIQQLAALFGKGDTYDSWLKTQTKWLKRMEADLERQGEHAPDGDLDDRLLETLVARTHTQKPQAPPLIGVNAHP